MLQSKPVVGLDIGTTKVAIVVGTLAEGLTKVLGSAIVPSAGMRKGSVIDVEECVSAVSSALEKAERNSGVSIEDAIVGIGGTDVVSTSSKGVIAVSRTDGEILESDVSQVIDAARAVAMPPNKEILHVIPKRFLVDGSEAVQDPVGMSGIRLEVEAQVIGVGSATLRNLTKCLAQGGIEAQDVVFNPIATSKALLSNKQMESGVMLLDIGGGTTGYAIFEENELITTNILPIGSQHFTNDIAIGLRISLEGAEQIKLKIGTANPSQVKQSETIDLAKYDPKEKGKVPKEMLAQILEARAKELFEKVARELKSIGKDGMLPAGVVLTGQGALLPGLIQVAKTELSLPVQVGSAIIQASGGVDKISDPAYATAVGLMTSGLTQTEQEPNRRLTLPKGWSQMIDKGRDILKQFLP